MSARVAPIILAALVAISAGAQERAARPFDLDDGQVNLALGRPYLYSAVPGYRLTANETDLQDLTDGELGYRADDKIWFDANAVAWYGEVAVNIQVDLGEVAPIGEIGIRLLGGAEQGGLKFPDGVIALVSDDARTWREVGRFNRRDPEDLARFGVPAEEGKAYTYPLRFRDLRAAGRYVGYVIQGQTSFIASDELWVFRGDFELAGEGTRFAEEGEPYTGDFLVHNFQPGGLTAFFPKPTVYACDNVQSYQAIHGYDNRPEETKGKPCEIIVDLPEGVTLRRFLLNPRYGGATVDECETEPISDEGGSFTRHYVPTRGIGIADWGTLFLQTTWPDGQAGTVRLGCRWEGGVQAPEPYTIEALHLEPVTTPRRLHLSIAWMTQMFWQKWPDFLETYRACGFTAVPVFPRYAQADDARLAADLDAAHAAGLQVADNESPLHAVWGQVKDFPEVACQLAAGPASWLCPSYRGALWQQEVEDIASRYARTGAEYLLYDCEVFSSWFGPAGGNEGAKQCSRCQESHAAQGGGDWDAFIARQGAEFYRAVQERIAELAPGASFQAGAYDVVPSAFYHDIWDWDALYPDLLQFAMPSLYGFRPADIGDEVRQERALLPRSDIIPWLQPGDLGEISAETLRCILLEVLFNGGRGAAYYTQDGFDGADLRAVSDVAAMLAPVEDTIMDGSLLAGATCDVATARVSGVHDGERALVLVGEYESASPMTVTVMLPEGFRGEVRELTPLGSQPVAADDGRLTVALDEVRARAFQVAAN